LKRRLKKYTSNPQTSPTTSHPTQPTTRLEKRNPELTSSQCVDRINSQMPLLSKVKISHIVVDNDGGINDLSSKVHTCVSQVVKGNAFEKGLDKAKILWVAMLICNDDGIGAFGVKMAALAYFTGMAVARR
jgi:hypothetical protein